MIVTRLGIVMYICVHLAGCSPRNLTLCCCTDWAVPFIHGKGSTSAVPSELKTVLVLSSWKVGRESVQKLEEWALFQELQQSPIPVQSSGNHFTTEASSDFYWKQLLLQTFGLLRNVCFLLKLNTNYYWTLRDGLPCAIKN